MKKRRIFTIVYMFIVILFTVFILLDTFVIEKTTGIEVTSKLISTQNIEKGETTVSTNSYKDDNISINVSTITNFDTEIYVADVQINNINYLKTAFANNKYGRNIKATTSTIAEQNNAILAINGDYYGFRDYGFVLRNGVIYRNTSRNGNNEDLVINSDGSFEIIDEQSSDLNQILKDGAIQVLSFGPALINDEKISVDENTEVGQAKSSNPRTAIGIIDELHYVFVVSDGRTNESEGLSLYELANIMKDLGCTTAYNLDGGGSSTMYFNGEIINNPTDGNSNGERKVSDIVYIGY